MNYLGFIGKGSSLKMPVFVGFIDSKTCTSVYRFAFNGKEQDNETYGEGNAFDFGARIYDSRLGRWMSLDPLQANYPGFSPYNFASNSPITIVDFDGRENVIYLIILPDASGPVKDNAQNIANSANKNFEALDVKTRVVVFESKGPMPPSFDVKNMDKTDAVAIIGGSKKSIEKFAEGINPKSSRFNDWTSPPPNSSKTSENTNINPERTDIENRIIGVDESELKIFSEGVKRSPSAAAGVLILHGAGHIGGNPPEHTESPLLDFEGPKMIEKTNEGRDITSKDENFGFAERLKKDEKFGDKPSQDNYDSKAKKNNFLQGASNKPFK